MNGENKFHQHNIYKIVLLIKLQLEKLINHLEKLKNH